MHSERKAKNTSYIHGTRFLLLHLVCYWKYFGKTNKYL